MVDAFSQTDPWERTVKPLDSGVSRVLELLWSDWHPALVLAARGQFSASSWRYCSQINLNHTSIVTCLRGMVNRFLSHTVPDGLMAAQCFCSFIFICCGIRALSQASAQSAHTRNHCKRHSMIPANPLLHVFHACACVMCMRYARSIVSTLSEIMLPGNVPGCRWSLSEVSSQNMLAQRCPEW